MEALLTWIVSHGYPVLFAMLLVSGLGVPIPEDVPLLAAGILADHGGMSVVQASFACGLFVLTRDSIVFGLGYRYGEAILDNRWMQRIVEPKQLHKVEKLIQEHGKPFVFLGRFLPGLRAGVFFAAGASHIRPLVFLAIDSLAALISIPIFVALGYVFSQNLEKLQRILADMRVAIWLALVVALLVGGVVWWRRRKRASS